MKNLHKLFYRDYFSDAIFSPILKKGEPTSPTIKAKNAELCGGRYSSIIKENPIKSVDIVNKTIRAKISYPGLVSGIGISHETGITGEFKLGVHFNFTYGLPVLYGSSVKGTLRSAFIAKEGNGKILEYEPYFLKKVTGRDWSQNEIKMLFESIFEGKEDGNPKSIYKRDIFFDAVIVETDNKGRILCSDSITPHGGPNKDNPLKNPIPITFMKIAPGCEMEFRFKLTDSYANGNKLFSAEEKEKLFKKIILTLGVGAKTNVGYGQFSD